MLSLHNKFKKNEREKCKISLKTSLGIFRILDQASLFYFKKLNKVHHGTVYKQGHVENPCSFTDQER